MSTLDWIITYEQVARGLPDSLRLTIEEDVPCTRTDDHSWDTDHSDKPPGFYPFRECTTCGVMRRNPEWRGRHHAPRYDWLNR